MYGGIASIKFSHESYIVPFSNSVFKKNQYYSKVDFASAICGPLPVRKAANMGSANEWRGKLTRGK